METTRYRFISPWGAAGGPVAIAAAWRESPLLAAIAGGVIITLVAVLSRIGSDIGADGVIVRRFFSSTRVPWSDIVAVTTQSHLSGQRLVVVLADGRQVILPAPTSQTTGLAQAYALIVGRIGQSRA